MPPLEFHGRVAFHETDAAGIVHFAQFFLYAEEAETQAMDALGLFAADSPFLYPRVQAHAVYSRPLRFHEAYAARIGLVRIGRSSLHWRTDILGENGTCARVTCVSARRREEDGEAAPFTPAEKEALQGLLLAPEEASEA